MKKSESIRLGLLLGIAASLTGCSGPSVSQRCVDNNGIVVPDQSCAEQDRQRGQSGSGVYPYRWYYGGWGAGLGTRVGGGGYQLPPNSTIVRPNSGGRAVGSGSSVRGFFGGTGSGTSAGS